jgi:hypothetical protein
LWLKPQEKPVRNGCGVPLFWFAIVNGGLRETLLTPRLGEQAGHVIRKQVNADSSVVHAEAASKCGNRLRRATIASHVHSSVGDRLPRSEVLQMGDCFFDEI